jgi:hypothetical protein
MDGDVLEDDMAGLLAVASACVSYDIGWAGGLHLRGPSEDPRATSGGDKFSVAERADGSRFP